MFSDKDCPVHIKVLAGCVVIVGVVDKDRTDAELVTVVPHIAVI